MPPPAYPTAWEPDLGEVQVPDLLTPPTSELLLLEIVLVLLPMLEPSEVLELETLETTMGIMDHTGILNQDTVDTDILNQGMDTIPMVRVKVLMIRPTMIPRTEVDLLITVDDMEQVDHTTVVEKVLHTRISVLHYRKEVLHNIRITMRIAHHHIHRLV